MPDRDLEFLVQNYRRLTPAEHRLLQERVVERGKTLRAEFLREVFERLVSWSRRRSAIAQLNGLDDAVLKDIGLHRSGIEAAVDGLPPAPPEKRQVFPQKPHLCLQRTG